MEYIKHMKSQTALFSCQMYTFLPKVLLQNFTECWNCLWQWWQQCHCQYEHSWQWHVHSDCHSSAVLEMIHEGNTIKLFYIEFLCVTLLSTCKIVMHIFLFNAYWIFDHPILMHMYFLTPPILMHITFSMDRAFRWCLSDIIMIKMWCILHFVGRNMAITKWFLVICIMAFFHKSTHILYICTAFYYVMVVKANFTALKDWGSALSLKVRLQTKRPKLRLLPSRVFECHSDGIVICTSSVRALLPTVHSYFGNCNFFFVFLLFFCSSAI